MRKTKPSKVVNAINPKYITPRNAHHLSKTDINSNALKVLNRLNSSGFQAYLVGGSVRDILLKKSPKDFDVATNAKPNQIRDLFKNARIIGRRFKLAHIIYQREIIEVATFRGDQEMGSLRQTNELGMLTQDNIYGTIEEDAFRRDFTINSLYYNIEDGSIVDFTNGLDDINNKIIRVIGCPSVRYKEDPVRMLRAIRFSAKLNFKIAEDSAESINIKANLIQHISSSRLFDEMTKLYQCGKSEMVQLLLEKHGLFNYLFPQTARIKKDNQSANTLIILALESTDTRVKENKPIMPAFIYAILLWFPLLEKIDELRKNDVEPLIAIEQAMSLVLSEQNKIILIPKRFTIIMREIWMLQYRLPRRAGKRAQNLLKHPRFRAGYDFLALRALAGNESMEIANWWTVFQDADATQQKQMVQEIQSEK